MRKRIKPLLITFLIGLMIFCYGIALAENDAEQMTRNIQILYKEDAPLTGRAGISLLENELEQEEPLNVALWGTLEGQILKFEEFNRESIVDLVIIIGDSSLLFSSQYSLGKEDASGILLSPDVARQLFGNTSARELPIIYSGEEFILRGILGGAENTAVIQGNRTTASVLDAAAIEIPENSSQATTIRKFESRFWTIDTVFDLGILRALGNFFIIILPLTIAAYLLLKCIKVAISYHKTPVKCGVFIGGIILSNLFFIWLNQDLPRIQLDFSPPMWSDFGYWRNYFSTKGETIGKMLQGEWREPERIAMRNTVLIIQYGIFATGIFLGFIRKIEVKNYLHLLLYSSGSLLGAFYVITHTGRNDFPRLWSLWGLGIFYVIIKMVLISLTDNSNLSYSSKNDLEKENVKEKKEKRKRKKKKKNQKTKK